MKNSFVIRFAAICLAALFNFQANAQFTFYGLPTQNEQFRENFYLGGFYYASGYDGEATLSKINATTQAIVWTKKYYGNISGSGTANPIFIDGIIESFSNNLLVSGYAFPGGTSWNNNQIVVMEINLNTGDILQTRHYNLATNSGDHRFASTKIVRAATGSGTNCFSCSGEYIMQIRRANGGGAYDEIMMMKLGYALNPIWANTYTDGNEWETYNMIATPGGGAMVAGVLVQGANRFGVLVEVDCSGNLIAANGYRTASNLEVYFTNILRDHTASGTGNIVVNGGALQSNNTFRGLIAKINAGTGLPIWSKSFAKPNESVLFTGLTQFKVVNGNIYTGYFTPDFNFGQFEPRILRVNAGTGAFMGYRDLGGPNLGNGNGFMRLTTNGTNKVALATGQPGPIGGDDAYLEIVPSNLVTANCAGATPQTAVNEPLTVTALPITQTDVLPFVLQNVHCAPAPQPWDKIAVTCPPYGNKPGSMGTDHKNTPHSAELELPMQYLTDQTAPFVPKTTASKSRNAAQTGAKLDFEIFPNPAKQTVEVSFPGGEGLEQRIEIHDLNGKQLKTLLVNDAEQTTLEIGDLPQGIYLIKTGSGAAQKLTKL